MKESFIVARLYPPEYADACAERQKKEAEEVRSVRVGAWVGGCGWAVAWVYRWVGGCGCLSV
jgi:hypothetical protein